MWTPYLNDMMQRRHVLKAGGQAGSMAELVLKLFLNA
jgi:hypothetical protein